MQFPCDTLTLRLLGLSIFLHIILQVFLNLLFFGNIASGMLKGPGLFIFGYQAGPYLNDSNASVLFYKLLLNGLGSASSQGDVMCFLINGALAVCRKKNRHIGIR